MGKSEKRRLVRIPSQGKISGVCAGVAEYTGTEAWLVRIIWFSGFLFSGGFFFIAYMAGWFILDKDESSPSKAGPFKRQFKDQWKRFDGKDIDEAVEVKSKVWQAGEPPRLAYKDLLRQFEGIESRVIEMESYVTSNRFTLKREINNL